MTNNQHSTSNLQSSTRHQAPNTGPLFKTLRLGSWIFSGCWMLDAGCFGRTCLLSIVALTAPLFPTHAQTNTTSQPNRYLFIIETSHSMQRRSDGMLAAVQQLLNSGIGGQLKRGDTLGVWTYNQDLYPGRFPLQHWSPETQRTVTDHVVSFLQQQKLEKQSTFVPVLPALEALVKNSPFLTVIVVSVGDQKIQGTPYDDQINALYASWEPEQQRARMPLLTILRAKAGKFTDFSVNAAPWPVEMPPLPKELFITQTPERKSTPPAAKASPPVGRNIILSGKKAPTVTPATTNAPNQIRNEQFSQLQTNSTEGTLAIPPETTAPTPALAPDTSKAAPVPLLKQAPQEKSSAPPPAPESHPKSPGASADLITNESVVATKAQESSSASTQPPPAFPDAAVKQPLAVATTAPTPPAPQNDSHQPTASSVSPDSARAPEPEAQKQPSSVHPASSVPVVAIAPKLFFDRPAILLLAISVTAGVLVVAWILLRRSRATRHVSLITRSLDHEKP